MEIIGYLYFFGLVTVIGIFSQGLVCALRDVSVSIPNAVRRSERAILKCLYDMEGDSLYSVKWYKGRREFYRYTPKENPAMKTFHIPGIKIDVHYSNESQLTLLNVQLVTSGKYSCEVSADAPSFHTLIAAGELDVVEPPNHNPAITGIRPRYKIGDIVRGNCTSRHSKPAANLTWTINNQEANPSHVRHHRPLRDSRNDMETAISGIHFVVTSQHFVYGKLKVRCTALIHDVYLKSTEKSIEEDRHKYGSSGGSGNSVNLVQTLPYDQFALQDGDLIDKKDTYLTNIQGDVSSLNAGGSGSTALISSAPTVTSVVLLLAIVLQLSHFYIHHLCSGGSHSSKSRNRTLSSSRTNRWRDGLTQRRTLTITPGVSLAMQQQSSSSSTTASTTTTTIKSLSLPTFSVNPSVSIGQRNSEFKDS
ncbi:uncharacterized protein LOC129913458 isoform X2 [Episyrphus balteatus]|uniref:uncharacterized protein LOC129913458 isoform X2 n=1 Tax=Episyrphus balteatus TaxID=286459 RepID=UPI00248681DB|nr:uncharacterized protein LOC129913458 isoform X2 [Episyrphus balteatus]